MSSHNRNNVYFLWRFEYLADFWTWYTKLPFWHACKFPIFLTPYFPMFVPFFFVYSLRYDIMAFTSSSDIIGVSKTGSISYIDQCMNIWQVFKTLISTDCLQVIMISSLWPSNFFILENFNVSLITNMLQVFLCL